MKIIGYESQYRTQVVELWKTVFGYSQKRNDPGLALDKKVEANDGLLFLAAEDGKILGTVMAGYDGHRGWIYSLAVAGDSRNKKIGTSLVQAAEKALVERGCPKINLQVLPSNSGVIDFYRKLGYSVEERISMGKSLVD
jgi:ribosomal protein S18 acetylase RimI-like enzyme